MFLASVERVKERERRRIDKLKEGGVRDRVAETRSGRGERWIDRSKARSEIEKNKVPRAVRERVQ